MKINNVRNFNARSVCPVCQKKLSQQVSLKKITPKTGYIDPKFYIAQRNISFKGNNEIIYIPKFSSNGDIQKISILENYAGEYLKPIEISGIAVNLLFKDKNGEVDNFAINAFSELFKENFGEKIQNMYKKIQFYKEIVDDYEPEELDGECDEIADDVLDEEYFDEECDEIFDIKEILLDEMSEKQTDDDMIRNIISRIPNEEEKKDLACDMLNMYSKMTLDDLMEESTKFALDFLYLSKLSDDCVTSQVKDKKYIIENSYEIEDNFGASNILEQFIQISKKEHGKADVQFIKNIIDIVLAHDVVAPLDEIGYLLAKYQAKDSSQKQKIADLMTELSKTYLCCEEEFEIMLNYAFNPVTNKFDQIAAEALVSIIEEISNWIDDEVSDYEENTEYYDNAQNEMIEEYFNLIKDEITGSVGEFVPSAKEFVEVHKKNYMLED